jgi:signal transduction histidine kinase/DNA-binding response OmpR family regulator
MEVPRSSIIAVGLLGAPAHFFFYFLFKYGLHLPYESFALRMIATLLCLSVLLKTRIPETLQQFFPIYGRIVMIFVLPFIFTVNLIMNDFHELWLYWEIFMVFVLMIFEENWIMFLLDIIIGVIGAILFYLLSPSSIALHPDFDITLYSIVMGFSIVVGYAFSYSKWVGLRAFEREKSEEKSKALEALAGGIAHEMRNPFAQIRHNLDEILMELPADHAGKESAIIPTKNIETINRRISQAQMAVTRALHVIDVTLANFRKDDLTVSDFACLSATAVTRKAIEEYGYASEQERSVIHLEPGEDFIFRGDENNYILVLYNLLVNALQVLHSTPGGRIDISVQRGEKFNRMLIRDNGPGIPPKILDRIFDPFFTSGKKGGTGLGLAFCKRVMQSFNGDITCKSELGRYTEFTLVFPLLEQSIINQYESKLYAEYTRPFSGKQLLLIDTPEQFAPVLRRQLAPLDMKKDEVSDGNEALRMITEKRYDLVLANAGLPPFGVDELVKGIKKTGRDIPVIAFSSSTSPSPDTCKGIDALISMPPALPELLSTMKTSLETVRETLQESLSGKTVLVADDLDFNRRVIKSMLNKLGVTILEANNGLEALEILKSKHCDLLVIDMRMPVLDGFDTAKRIRSTPSPYQDMPILGLSGNLDNTTLKMVRESGINDSLIKPLKLKVFLQKVSAMLKISQPN